MLADLNQKLNYELKDLEYEKMQYSMQLENCNGYENAALRGKPRSNGGSYYYVRRPGSNRFIYIGSKSLAEVSKTRKAHSLKEALQRINFDIKLINAFIKGYLPHDSVSVNAALPEIYQNDLLPVSNAYQVEGSKWKSEKLVFQAQFPENYPEHKKHTTSDGVKVKSLSELLLYERFNDAGFSEVYELPLPMEDYGPPLYPDFTILSPIDMKTEIYVEYVGRLDLPKYRDDFARRVGRYIANGYVPGVNVFFIFGDKDGHVDSTQINKVIADIRGI